MTPRRFTPEEDAIIVTRFRAGHTLRQIGTETDRSWSVIQQRIRILMRRGQLDYGKRNRRPWTAQAEQELRGLWGWHAPPVVAQKLGRSLNSVNVKAKRLGLSCRWKGAYNARAVGRVFAVDSKTVGIWIRYGWLAAKQSKVGAGKNRRWRIEHEAIERFIRDYPMYYERRRITEPYWRDLADKAWAVFDLVPIHVAAKKLGVCDETLKRRIRRGEWQAEKYVVGGGYTWMVRTSDLARFEYIREPVEMVYAKGHMGAIRKAVTV